MPKFFLVIDVEATCWEKKGEHTDENEIIEIGAVLIDNSNSVTWSASWFVKPILNPILSEFCLNLTSIKQADIDSAPSFPTAISALVSEVEKQTNQAFSENIFVSWGNYDRNQFLKDCERHAVAYPFGPHVNIKAHFLEKYGLKKAGVPRAMEVLGLPFKGTHHRGIDDALNIAQVFISAFGAEYPFSSKA